MRRVRRAVATLVLVEVAVHPTALVRPARRSARLVADEEGTMQLLVRLWRFNGMGRWVDGMGG